MKPQTNKPYARLANTLPSTLILIIILLSQCCFAQGSKEGRSKELHFKEGEVTTGRARENTPEPKGQRENNAVGSSEKHDRSEYTIRTGPVADASTVPLGYPGGVSPITLSSLQELITALKAITGIQKILAGTPVLDLLGDERLAEDAANIILRVLGGDYTAMKRGISTLETIKQQQIQDIAARAGLEVSREFPLAGDNYSKRQSLNDEQKFWERLQYMVFDSHPSNISLSKYTIAFVSSPMKLALEYGSVQMINGPLVNGFKIYTAPIRLLNAMNKENRFEVFMKYSRDSTFGIVELYGDESIIRETSINAWLTCPTDDFQTAQESFIYFPDANFIFTPGKIYYIQIRVICYVDDIQRSKSYVSTYQYDTNTGVSTFYRMATAKETREFNSDFDIIKP